MILLTGTDVLDFLDSGRKGSFQGQHEVMQSVLAVLRLLFLVFEALALVFGGLIAN